MPDPYLEPIEESKTAEPVEAGGDLGLKKEELPAGPEKEKVVEEDIIKETMPPAASPAPSAPLPSAAAQKISPVQEAQRIRGFEKNQQLKSLVDLAFEKGVYYATEVVKNLDNPYLLDEFHDILVDELHKKLVERGKLEEI